MLLDAPLPFRQQRAPTAWASATRLTDRDKISVARIAIQSDVVGYRKVNRSARLFQRSISQTRALRPALAVTTANAPSARRISTIVNVATRGQRSVFDKVVP